jgi:protein-S-isoprenylcysteine O-methyltransferase Ste14
LPNPSEGPLARAGHVLFRVRNALFPIVFAAVLLLFPPPVEGGAAWVAAGLALLVAGQAIRVLTIGFVYIKRGGKDGRVYAPGLVTGGIFAHCRNPMYLGNLLLVLGYLTLAGNPFGLLAGAAFFLFAYGAIIAAEEGYLRGRFGEEYRAYCARVPRLLPRLRGLRATLGPLAFDWRKVLAKEYGTLYLTLVLTLGIVAWRLLRAGGSDGLRAHLPALSGVAAAGTVAYAAARLLKKRGAWRRPVAG